MLFWYHFLLLLMFLLISIGATIAAFQSVDYLKQPLLDSLKNYNPESPAEEKQGITQAWDDVQKEFKCCGVNNYTDWKNPGTIYHDNDLEVPKSCCDGFEPSVVNECRQNPDDEHFKSQMKGCFTIFKNSLEKSKGTIVVVGGTIIGAIFLNLVLLFGFVLCLMPKTGYEQV